MCELSFLQAHRANRYKTHSVLDRFFSECSLIYTVRISMMPRMYKCWSVNFGITVLIFASRKHKPDNVRENLNEKSISFFPLTPFFVFIYFFVKLLLLITMHCPTTTTNVYNDYFFFVVHREYRGLDLPDRDIPEKNLLIGSSWMFHSCSRSRVRSYIHSWSFHCWSHHRVVYLSTPFRWLLASQAVSPHTLVYPANKHHSHRLITQTYMGAR